MIIFIIIIAIAAVVVFKIYKSESSDKGNHTSYDNDIYSGEESEFKISLNKHTITKPTLNSPLNKLDENGELPFDWLTANKGFIYSHDNKLNELHISCHESGISLDEEIKRIKAFISYYYEYKSECERLGECYYKYFEDMHMKCHNSKNSCFESVTPKEERLDYIEKNYDRLKQLEIEKDKLPKTVLEKISNDDGVLQSELIKSYDEELQPSVRNLLYQLNNENIIRKEKSGRSYKLYIVNKD